MTKEYSERNIFRLPALQMKTIEVPASEPKLKEEEVFFDSLRSRRNIAREVRS